MATLLNVDAAIEKILKTIAPLGGETIRIEGCYGRILSEAIVAEVDLPPFASSSVDGYAVRVQDIAGASDEAGVTLVVVMDILAGSMPTRTLGAGEAARIMTGAPVPEGANCVVMVEDTDSSTSKASWRELPDLITIKKVGIAGQNIRPVGENVRRGEQVLGEGEVLNAAGVGMLAALGVGDVGVIRRARVAILSSGDELVGVDEALTAGKIRDVNRYTLQAMCEAMGAEAVCLPVARDNEASVRQMFVDALALEPDMILSSAGVSVGVADYTRDILDEMGKVDLWRINLRPGKPLVYGELGGIPFFGLPGNPVSAMVTFEVLVRPALAKMMGFVLQERYVDAYTAHEIGSDGRRSYLRVTLAERDGRLYASETGTQSSGALMSMVKADGLLIIPEGVYYVEENQMMKVKLLKPLRGILS